MVLWSICRQQPGGCCGMSSDDEAGSAPLERFPLAVSAISAAMPSWLAASRANSSLIRHAGDARHPLGELAPLLLLTPVALDTLLQCDQSLRFRDGESAIQQGIDQQILVLI